MGKVQLRAGRGMFPIQDLLLLFVSVTLIYRSDLSPSILLYLIPSLFICSLFLILTRRYSWFMIFLGIEFSVQVLHIGGVSLLDTFIFTAGLALSMYSDMAHRSSEIKEAGMAILRVEETFGSKVLNGLYDYGLNLLLVFVFMWLTLSTIEAIRGLQEEALLGILTSPLKIYFSTTLGLVTLIFFTLSIVVRLASQFKDIIVAYMSQPVHSRVRVLGELGELKEETNKWLGEEVFRASRLLSIPGSWRSLLFITPILLAVVSISLILGPTDFSDVLYGWFTGNPYIDPLAAYTSEFERWFVDKSVVAAVLVEEVFKTVENFLEFFVWLMWG